MKNWKKIVLVGMRGCGKSHFGTCLSMGLQWAKMDTDHLLEEQEGKTVAAIVQQEGWEVFRAKEKALIQKVSAFENVVLCTGGGSILDSENREALKKDSLVIFLFATLPELVERIENDPNRPPLIPEKTTAEEVLEIWNARKDLYLSMADISFRPKNDLDENTRKNVEKNAEILLKKIKTLM